MIPAARAPSAPQQSQSADGAKAKSLIPICGAQISASDHVTA